MARFSFPCATWRMVRTPQRRVSGGQSSVLEQQVPLLAAFENHAHGTVNGPRGLALPVRLHPKRDGGRVLYLATTSRRVKPTAIETSQRGLPARSADRTSVQQQTLRDFTR